MTDPLPDFERNEESSTVPPGMPRWVKVSLVGVVILAVVFVVVMALSGAEHGPGLHTGAGAQAHRAVARALL